MRLAGEWLRCNDGITRPFVRATVRTAGAASADDLFLIDTGADRTVLSARVLAELGGPSVGRPAGFDLEGISGATPFVVVEVVLEFTRDNGVPVRVRGEYAAFTDPTATEQSILGRDVLNNFDLIVSRRRDDILLLAPPHTYRIEPA